MSSRRSSALRDRSESDLFDESIEFKQQEWIDYRFASEEEGSEDSLEKRKKKESVAEAKKPPVNTLLVPPAPGLSHTPISLDLFDYESPPEVQIKQEEQYWQNFRR